MAELYPFTFDTIFKEKLWGGEKINNILKKDFSPLPNCGETWELSAVPNDVSIVANGSLKGESINSLLSTYKEKLVGVANYKKFGDQFPLLIKFIDAAKDLSVQVHPDDKLSKSLHGEGYSGKSEMWYIVQADKNASLISGFNEKIDKKEFKKRLAKSQLEPVLNRDLVKEGDVYYIPAGRIHTIGKGILIAEIQQTSDLTYRIFDFDRVDSQGNKRELHVEKAAEALDFEVQDSYKTNYAEVTNNASQLVRTEFFTANKWCVTERVELDYSNLDSFVILIGLKGHTEIGYESSTFSLTKGDVFLIPASIPTLSAVSSGKSEFLEVYIS